MTDKKLIDNEIVKELERYSDVSDSDITTTCFKTRLLKEIYLFINRLQAKLDEAEDTIQFADKELKKVEAENERLTTLVELGNMRANDYRVMRDRALKAEAENEKLTKDKENLAYSLANAVGQKMTAKAEAYKECMEQLDAEIESSDKYIREYDDSELQKAYNKGLRNALKALKGLVGDK